MPESPLHDDEDAELRRLHMLTGFGSVAQTVVTRYETLRRRDRRQEVRDPQDVTLASAVEKNLWGETTVPAQRVALKTEQPAAERHAPVWPEPTKAITLPDSTPERVVIADTREVLAERPQPRRGLGLFRR